MKFENVAYLFDTSMLGTGKKNSVYGVLSFVGNSLFVPAYAKETMAQFNVSVTDETALPSLLSDPVKSESLFNLLIKVYDDVDQLGITSYFIEKDYSAFIYLMGLMLTNVQADEPNFRTHLDNLYFAYQKVYDDGIKRDSISETVTVFNQRIQHLLQTQKEHKFFKSLLNEKGRQLSEQISILQLLEKDSESDFMVADYFFYTKQLTEIYKENGVHDIYASSYAAERFSKAIGRFFKSAEVNLNASGQPDEDYETVSQLARILLMISDYYLGKIVETKDMKELDEMDRYLFVIVWMILHGGENNMFINGSSYDVIKDVFLSLKKGMDV